MPRDLKQEDMDETQKQQMLPMVEGEGTVANRDSAPKRTWAQICADAVMCQGVDEMAPP